MQMIVPDAAVGGFFGLALADIAPSRKSLWNMLVGGASTAIDFSCARAAIIWLLGRKVRPGARVWLPDYCCPELTRAIRRARFELKLYPVGSDLAPDIRGLAGLRAGDAAIAVDYFGRLPSRAFRAFVRAHPDILWIEDRAQALDPGPAWAPWAVYSLRKIAGVCDGALLVSADQKLTAGRRMSRPLDAATSAPELLRFEDMDGSRNDEWYAAYRKRERRITDEPLPASRLARALAERLPFEAIRAARRANYAALHDRIGERCIWPERLGRWTPFAFPLVVDDARAVVQTLARRQIFCARHWAVLPRGAGEDALCLAGRLVSLPCDQRYCPADMKRIVDVLRAERLLGTPVRRGNW